jgi:hypothetical protein
VAILLPPVLFIHCPRTGGTSVRRALAASGGIFLNHLKPVSHVPDAKLGKIKKHIWVNEKPHIRTGFHYRTSQLLQHNLITPEQRKNLIVFTIIRNPLDSITSQYQKLRNGKLIIGSNSELKAQAAKRYQQNPFSFSEFLHDYPGLLTGCANNMMQYVEEADVVMRFETLADDFKDLVQAAGINAELPHINTTGNKMAFESYYSLRDLSFAKRLISRQLKTLGYS